MKKIFLFIVCFSIIVFANAQSPSFLWAKEGGGAGWNMSQGNSVQVDSVGSVITVGEFNGTVDFDPGVGVYNLTSTAGSYDIFISKLDSLGNFVWAKQIGDSLYEVGRHVIDASGNLYLAGSYRGTVDFDPGIGIYNITSSGATLNTFILKLNPAGNFLWAKSVGGSGFYPTEASSIAIDILGNIYVAGGFEDMVDFDPGPATFNISAGGNQNIFVLKLDNVGDFVWAKNMGGAGISLAVPYSIVLDLAGNIYSTGRFFGTIDFDPGPGVFDLTSTGGTFDHQIFVSKIDTAGNFVWAKHMEGTLQAFGLSVATDLYNDVYITGSFGGTVDFDPSFGVYNLTSLGSSGTVNMFISKLNASGDFLWAKAVLDTIDSQGRGIAIDTAGYVYITGSISGTLDFDLGSGVFNLNCSSNTFVAILSKFDTAGNFIWGGSLNGNLLSSSSAGPIVLDKDNNIYTVGSYGGTIDFDPGAGLYNLSASADEDYFVYKMSKSSSVWPGDADKSKVVDNNDLLPLGLFYGQTGPPRATISNTWQAFVSTDWGILQASGDDIKHVDCNGDGTIDNNDTLAVNLNFALTHAFAPTNNEVRLPGADLHFVTSSTSYLSGSIVDVEVWAGDATTPVTNLYGLAFDINYDASLVQPSSESLMYPTSWLGTPGTDAIIISKVDALANTAYGAETRIDHTNVSGFGKIADFKFQLKSSIPANTVMSFSISGYQANDATGTPVLFNTLVDSIVVNPTSVGVSEINIETQISIYPNPTNGSFNISTSHQVQNGSIEIYNVVGELILSEKIINQQNTIDLKNQASGLYFVKVISDGKVIGMKKVVKE